MDCDSLGSRTQEKHCGNITEIAIRDSSRLAGDFKQPSLSSSAVLLMMSIQGGIILPCGYTVTGKYFVHNIMSEEI